MGPAGMTRQNGSHATEFSRAGYAISALFGLEGVGDAASSIGCGRFQITGGRGMRRQSRLYRRQLIGAEGAVEGLYRQQLAVAVDRQPGLALDGAVEQAVRRRFSASSRAMITHGRARSEKVGNVRWHEEPYCEGGKAHMMVAQAGERAFRFSAISAVALHRTGQSRPCVPPFH